MEFRKVYLDGAASSPLDPEALKDMEEYMAGGYVGNSFSLYDDGIRSMQAVEKARGELAEALGVEPGQILFTSGATESNNWAIESTCMRALKNRSNKMMILSSPIEHSSVLNSARRMEVLGFRLKFTGLSPKGYVRSEDVSDADLDEAAVLGNTIRRRVGESVVVCGQHVTVSIGASTWHGSFDTAEKLFQRADAALYEAKGDGRNCLRVEPPAKTAQGG